MNKEQVAADLRGARNLIIEHGWCQGQAENAAGNLCTMGALWRASGAWSEAGARAVNTRVSEARSALVEVLDLDSVSANTVSRWNDAPSRTAQDVLDAFEKAALRVEEQA